MQVAPTAGLLGRKVDMIPCHVLGSTVFHVASQKFPLIVAPLALQARQAVVHATTGSSSTAAVVLAVLYIALAADSQLQ